MAGRGRGRGRGPAILPFTDEETGKRVSLDVDAPPKLFPDLELPEVTEGTELEKALMVVWQKLLNATRALPYYLRLDAAQATGMRAGDVEPPPAPPATASGRSGALEQVLTLHPSTFPEELYSRTQRRQSERASVAQAFGDRDKDLGADFFERFDRLDRAAGDEDGEAGPGGGAGGAAAGAGAGRGAEGRDGAAPRKPGGGEDEEEEEGGEAEEEEAVFEEDDDYLQGNQYDDDEEYEDLDDGGEEGPTY